MDELEEQVIGYRKQIYDQSVALSNPNLSKKSVSLPKSQELDKKRIKELELQVQSLLTKLQSKSTTNLFTNGNQVDADLVKREQELKASHQEVIELFD